MNNWKRWTAWSIVACMCVTVATLNVATCVRLDRSVTAGTIVAKVFHPAHLQTTVIGGKSPVIVCTYIPDAWYIEIEGTDMNGNARRIEQSVHEQEYDAAEIGATWTRTPNP